VAVAGPPLKVLDADLAFEVDWVLGVREGVDLPSLICNGLG
jgi:hypothetical protein